MLFSYPVPNFKIWGDLSPNLYGSVSPADDSQYYSTESKENIQVLIAGYLVEKAIIVNFFGTFRNFGQRKKVQGHTNHAVLRGH
jgi:hypothetical protein